LEDHLHALAQVPHFVLRKLGDIFAIEDYSTLRRVQKTQDDSAESGLPASGLTDDCQGLSPDNRQINIIDGMNPALRT
jgi:hypothetical protein